MTQQPGTPPEAKPRHDIRVVGGGPPSPEEEAALAIAVSRVLAARDARRAAPEPIWGVVGRLESRDSVTVRARSMLPSGHGRTTA